MRRVPVVPRTSSFRRSSRRRRASASISQNLQNNKRKSTKDNFQIIISLFIPFSIFSDLTFCMFFYHSSPHFLDFSDPWKHRVANTWLEIGIIGMCLVAFVAFVAAPEEGQRSYECIRHLEVTNLLHVLHVLQVIMLWQCCGVFLISTNLFFEFVGRLALAAPWRSRPHGVARTKKSAELMPRHTGEGEGDERDERDERETHIQDLKLLMTADASQSFIGCLGAFSWLSWQVCIEHWAVSTCHIRWYRQMLSAHGKSKMI